jgi:beta-lactam-binding protein with PASTA domain
MEGQQPIPCPEFATQELDTGSTSFTVGSGAPLVHVPNLRGLKPATADRRLKRRHLRVRYTALSNLCAGIPPHGRIIVQKPVAGTMVPRGSKVLVQTSCGT